MLGGVFAPRFTFMGRQVWLQKKTLAEAPGNRLNRKIDTLLGLVTGVG